MSAVTGLVGNPDHALGLTAGKSDLKANVRNIFLQTEMTLYFGGLIEFPLILTCMHFWTRTGFYCISMFVCLFLGVLLMANLILQVWLG